MLVLLCILTTFYDALLSIFKLNVSPSSFIRYTQSPARLPEPIYGPQGLERAAQVAYSSSLADTTLLVSQQWFTTVSRRTALDLQEAVRPSRKGHLFEHFIVVGWPPSVRVNPKVPPQQQLAAPTILYKARALATPLSIATRLDTRLPDSLCFLYVDSTQRRTASDRASSKTPWCTFASPTRYLDDACGDCFRPLLLSSFKRCAGCYVRSICAGTAVDPTTQHCQVKREARAEDPVSHRRPEQFGALVHIPDDRRRSIPLRCVRQPGGTALGTLLLPTTAWLVVRYHFPHLSH